MLKQTNKRQRRALHIYKGVNQTKIYNICKYLGTKIWAPKYVKQILTEMNGEINSNTIIIGDFNTSLISIDTSR